MDWIAWWWNGLTYDDSEDVMVGVYSTPEIARKQGEKYHKKHVNSYMRNAKVTIQKVKVDRKVIN